MYVCTVYIQILFFFPFFFFISIPFLLSASYGTTQGMSKNRKQGVIRESFINSWWICKKKKKRRDERRSEAWISLVSSDFFLSARSSSRDLWNPNVPACIRSLAESVDRRIKKEKYLAYTQIVCLNLGDYVEKRRSVSQKRIPFDLIHVFPSSLQEVLTSSLLPSLPALRWRRIPLVESRLKCWNGRYFRARAIFLFFPLETKQSSNNKERRKKKIYICTILLWSVSQTHTALPDFRRRDEWEWEWINEFSKCPTVW